MQRDVDAESLSQKSSANEWGDYVWFDFRKKNATTKFEPGDDVGTTQVTDAMSKVWLKYFSRRETRLNAVLSWLNKEYAVYFDPKTTEEITWVRQQQAKSGSAFCQRTRARRFFAIGMGPNQFFSITTIKTATRSCWRLWPETSGKSAENIGSYCGKLPHRTFNGPQYIIENRLILNSIQQNQPARKQYWKATGTLLQQPRRPSFASRRKLLTGKRNIFVRPIALFANANQPSAMLRALQSSLTLAEKSKMIQSTNGGGQPPANGRILFSADSYGIETSWYDRIGDKSVLFVSSETLIERIFNNDWRHRSLCLVAPSSLN